MAKKNSTAIVVWRFDDGKPGHSNQSLGLVNAISRHIPVDCYTLPPMKFLSCLYNFAIKQFPPGKLLPVPELIIGAGHSTHFSVMCAQHAFGGKTIILMKPSLPACLFDLCVIPEHDHPVTEKNIIITRGALNTIIPSGHFDENLGLIMVGGPSKHFDWNTKDIIRQINIITKTDHHISWLATDSSRTPAMTSKALRELNIDNLKFISCAETPSGWLANQLKICGKAWVSADSVSMIFESLTSGKATGILAVPEKNPNKISQSINQLNRQGMLTSFRDWESGKLLVPPADKLYEADRCAREIINKFYAPGT